MYTVNQRLNLNCSSDDFSARSIVHHTDQRQSSQKPKIHASLQVEINKNTMSRSQKKWFPLMGFPQKTAFRQSIFSLKAQLFK